MRPLLIAATGGATDVAALSVPTLLLPTLTEQAPPQLSCAVYIHGLASSSSSLLSPCYPSGVVMDPLQFLLPPSQYHRPGLLRPLHHIPTIQMQAPHNITIVMGTAVLLAYWGCTINISLQGPQQFLPHHSRGGNSAVPYISVILIGMGMTIPTLYLLGLVTVLISKRLPYRVLCQYCARLVLSQCYPAHHC